MEHLKEITFLKARSKS